MTKQSLKHLALSLACLGLLLSVSPSLAQNKLTISKRILSRRAAQGATHSAGTALPNSPSYSFSYFDFPQSLYTIPTAINSGAATSKILVVGDYDPELDSGFLVQVGMSKGTINEAYSAVSFPGSSDQGADGVNDLGQIVGTYDDSAGVQHGYEFNGGTFTTIDVPFSGATATGPTQINNSGEIVGVWIDSSNVEHGFSLIGGVYTSFDYPGATNTDASCVNNEGDIVGAYQDSSGNYHGFLLSGGTYTSINVPGALETVVIGNNDPGDAVGWYCTDTACDDYQGYLLSGGVFTTILAPGADTGILWDLNNKGVIVGSYSDSRGGPEGGAHAFVATP
jgi:probable HAF family extracellular repeat protein